MSEGFRRIYQVDLDKVNANSRPFFDVLHPDDRDRTERAVRESAETLGAYDQEFRVIGQDGRVTWCRSIAQPKRLDNGDTVWDGVAVDITVQKRAQAEIQDLNERLERRVKERTSELRAAQEELVRKERLAALGQLTGTVSHELRNPLGALRAAVATVKKLTEGEQQPMLTNTVAIIDRSITRCDNIIGDLLDYSRGESPALAPTALDSWLGQALDQYPLPPWLELSREIETGAQAMLDRERLRRVLINLLDNGLPGHGGRCGPRARAGGPPAERHGPPGRGLRGDFGRRHGAGDRAGGPGEDFRAPVQHQELWRRFGPFHRQADRRAARWADRGRRGGGRRDLLHALPATRGRAMPGGPSRRGGRIARSVKGKQ